MPSYLLWGLVYVFVWHLFACCTEKFTMRRCSGCSAYRTCGTRGWGAQPPSSLGCWSPCSPASPTPPTFPSTSYRHPLWLYSTPYQIRWRYLWWYSLPTNSIEKKTYYYLLNKTKATKGMSGRRPQPDARPLAPALPGLCFSIGCERHSLNRGFEVRPQVKEALPAAGGYA